MSQILADFSNALAENVAQSGASIVRVEARRRLPASGVVWSADGVILTANHVIHHDENIAIGLPDGKVVPAKLVGRDPSTDLAVLRVEASGLTPFTSAHKQETAVGHIVLALGRPGKTVQATLGLISAWGDPWRTPMGGHVDHYLQTDIVMYPGFSGGPLVNANGRLVGLNSSALAQGVTVSVPFATLERVTESLLTHGKVRRGYLGVSTQRIRFADALRETLAQKSGLMVVGVESGSPAEKGGLSLGDTILAVADVTVITHDDLLAQLTSDRVGTAVAVRILRGGKQETLEVTVGEK